MPEADAEAFEAATSRYRRELFAHCYRVTGPVQEAEDIVQGTCLRAWRGFGRFERRSSVRTWLYRIATNVAALKSLLQRARVRLAKVPLSDQDLAEPSDKGAGRVLDQYMAAFAKSDMAAPERQPADDAALEMTGTITWFSGKATCAPYLSAFAIGSPGDWQMV